MSLRAFVRALDGFFYFWKCMVEAVNADLYEAYSIRTTREGKLLEVGVVFKNPENDKNEND